MKDGTTRTGSGGGGERASNWNHPHFTLLNLALLLS